MAIFHDFKCPDCGFEIRTADDYNYCLMSGTYVTVKCNKCGVIQTLCVSPKYYMEGVAGFDQFLNRLPYILWDSICSNCGQKGDFVRWKPKDGCPKCGKLLKGSGYIMAD